MLLEFAAGGDLFDKIAPDVGVGEDVARLYFGQLVEGMVSHTLMDIQCANAPKELHTLARRLPSRSQARELTSGRSWDAENIRFWPGRGFQIKRQWENARSYRTLRKLTICRTRGNHICINVGKDLPKALQLNSEGAYQAEPIDAWGVGVILFTLLAGSTFYKPNVPNMVSRSLTQTLLGMSLLRTVQNIVDIYLAKSLVKLRGTESVG